MYRSVDVICDWKKDYECKNIWIVVKNKNENEWGVGENKKQKQLWLKRGSWRLSFHYDVIKYLCGESFVLLLARLSHARDTDWWPVLTASFITFHSFLWLTSFITVQTCTRFVPTERKQSNWTAYFTVNVDILHVITRELSLIHI